MVSLLLATLVDPNTSERNPQTYRILLANVRDCAGTSTGRRGGAARARGPVSPRVYSSPRTHGETRRRNAPGRSAREATVQDNNELQLKVYRIRPILCWYVYQWYAATPAAKKQYVT